MIKVTYDTHSEKLKKDEHTKVVIHEGRYFAQYSISGKAEAIVKQMINDGRTGVLFSRGVLIQNFKNKSEEEILQIVLKDIENGLLVAEKKQKQKLEVKNLKIIRNEKN